MKLKPSKHYYISIKKERKKKRKEKNNLPTKKSPDQMVSLVNSTI